MNTYSGLVNGIIEIIGLIIPAIFALAFLYLVWKLIDAWIINAGDETKRTEGKTYLISAVVVFVAMISVWGLVNMISTSLFG